MSLFQQLRRLSNSDRFQKEDFHTEIVAQVLRNSPALTMEWLRDIGATSLQSADHIGIDTQERFLKLATHGSSSRLDLTIRLVANGRTELIFIESKLLSKQGVDQLQKYAEQLEAAHSANPLDRTSLVFITQNYELAEQPTLSDPSFILIFRPTRWFIFYRHLKVHLNGDGLAKELKLFMEENRMSLGNQFRSTDLVAMENFFSAKALMDETLQGEVSNAARTILGKVSNLKKAANELRDHNRYIVRTVFGPWDFFCMIGYFLPRENPDQPAWVGIDLQCRPSSKIRNEIITAFKGWCEMMGEAWSPYALDDEGAWSGIRKGKTLQTFLAGEDHVKAIKDHLLGLLEEVRQFRQAYDHLPWDASSAEVEAETE